MVKPEIVSEKPVTMAELKHEVEAIKKRDKELNARVGKTEEYLSQFVTLSKAKEEELIKQLTDLAIPRLKDVHIVNIVDVMPKSVDELKVILQGYTITVSNDNLKKIVGIITEFAEKKK